MLKTCLTCDNAEKYSVNNPCHECKEYSEYEPDEPTIRIQHAAMEDVFELIRSTLLKVWVRESDVHVITDIIEAIDKLEIP